MIWLLLACGSPRDTDTDATAAGWWPDDDARTDPFADAVVSFTPGQAAGFGADSLPDVVLGPPSGSTTGTPSLDVLSLGREGEIVLQLVDFGIVDGEGPDLIVFENPMPQWKETGRVAVSDDGEAWAEFPCDPTTTAQAGCAGTHVVYAGPGAADPTDADAAGGDAYDLSGVGLDAARFVRIRDTGANSYLGATGGFDLDAIAVTNGEQIE